VTTTKQNRSTPTRTTKDGDYQGLLSDIKSRIRDAQIRASLSVNRELIKLYWDGLFATQYLAHAGLLPGMVSRCAAANAREAWSGEIGPGNASRKKVSATSCGRYSLGA